MGGGGGGGTSDNVILLTLHTVQNVHTCNIIQLFEGEYSHEFRGFRATRQSFLHEIWACHTHLCWDLAFCKSFDHEMVTLTNPQKFSPSKVSRYTVRCSIL